MVCVSMTNHAAPETAMPSHPVVLEKAKCPEMLRTTDVYHSMIRNSWALCCSSPIV